VTILAGLINEPAVWIHCIFFELCVVIDFFFYWSLVCRCVVSCP
jgi:hypothetical protein